MLAVCALELKYKTKQILEISPFCNYLFTNSLTIMSCTNFGS